MSWGLTPKFLGQQCNSYVQWNSFKRNFLKAEFCLKWSWIICCGIKKKVLLQWVKNIPTLCPFLVFFFLRRIFCKKRINFDDLCHFVAKSRYPGCTTWVACAGRSLQIWRGVETNVCFSIEVIMWFIQTVNHSDTSFDKTASILMTSSQHHPF